MESGAALVPIKVKNEFFWAAAVAFAAQNFFFVLSVTFMSQQCIYETDNFQNA